MYVSEPQCVNWGVYDHEAVRVYEGEAGRIHCPLFSHPKLYNYTQIHNTGHTLLWYRHTHELEEPVDLSLPKFLKHRDALWIQPASLQDRGEYICLLSTFRDAQALLEVRASMSAMLHGGSVKLVLVQFKTTRTTHNQSIKQNTHKCVKELQRARIALALVRWEGEKSNSLTSRFWKKLRLQLPVRTMTHTTKCTPHTSNEKTSESMTLMLKDLHTHDAHSNSNTTTTEHVDTECIT
ncbi:Interleukin-1 receptor accessory protein [Bagarius yarrelli]|uniref:Interleukin-1 receptor accessory protein n=1 Tax=Bagarius yarrelli TaxID=175774 RepID=A0A556V7K7_BAGYA|nr:Interleukin-1 receptor accessory protein [Bagarius yarrelli]